MNKIRKEGQPISGYIDDFLLVKKTYIKSITNTLSTAEFFTNLGFVVHPERSVFIPNQKITYLGFVIDSVNMTLKLTEKRVNSLKKLLNTLINVNVLLSDL